MSFDLEGARKAGYSDAEIADYLGKSAGFDVSGARSAGYSDAEIVKHLSGPGPSLGERIVKGAKDAGGALLNAKETAGNYRDTQFSKGIGAVAGLPRLVGDVSKWAEEKTGVPTSVLPVVGPALTAMRHLPTGEDASKTMLGVAASRPGFKETNLHPVVDAGVQAAFAGPLVGAGGFMGPFANVGGAIASEAAGEATKGSDIEPYARIAGGVVGAGAPYGIRYAWNAGEAAVSPFTAGGREKIVGKTLVNQSADAPAAISRMENYSTPVPGFQIPAGKASRDPGLMALEEVAAAKTPGMRAVVDNNNAVLSRALDALESGGDPKRFVAEIAKQDAAAAMRAQAALDALPAGADAAAAGEAVRNALRGRFDALVSARTEATRPLYEAAKADPTPVEPFPLMMSTADAVAANKGDLKTAAQSVRSLLFKADGKPDRSAAGMMATRDAITDMIGSAQPGSKQQQMLMSFKDEVDAALAVVPPERAARQKFAEMSRPLDAFSAEKGNPFVANVIEKDRYGSGFILPAERVPSQFFRSGDAGAATMKEFLAANAGNKGAIDSMRSFISGKARDAKDVKAFLQQNRPAIEALDPALARQLEEAATTKGLAAGFRTSPAGKFIDGDLDAAVRSTLGAPDSVKRMQALRMAVGNNEEAVAGLRRAVLEDFKTAASSRVSGDASGNARLTANGAATWLEKNRGAAANVLTPDQVKALEAVTKALKDQAATIPGRTGSPTFDRLATESIIGALVSPRFADAPVLSSVNRALGLAYGGANEATMNRLFEVIQDPKVAAALMKKATAGNVRMIEPILATTAKSLPVSQAVGQW